MGILISEAITVTEKLKAWIRFERSGNVNDYLSYNAIKADNNFQMHKEGDSNYVNNNAGNSC